MNTFFNPVLRGMYPDPSMCSANGKYYLVCSTFCYFPGVPIFESQDLINWHCIGHCLTRKSQLNLTGTSIAGGIYAPTIRFNAGRFYMVVTNVTHGGNFYVWTDDIYGEWSEPVYVEQDGIDPSLFFDDDGKVYFISNGSDDAGTGYIQISEIDIETGKKLSDNKPLWYGTGGRYIEAPHMYKFNGYYYLLNAEGGTEYGHMVNYARSKNLFGPFEPCPKNPVLTNRNLGGYVLQGAGHGDILQASDGTWWFCHLAFRQIDKYMPFHHLGRETCMEPVVWEDDWFYIGTPLDARFANQGYGVALTKVDLPFAHNFAKQDLSYNKTISTLTKNKEWNFLRNPHEENYKIDEKSVKIVATPITLENLDESPSWIGVRQAEFNEDFCVNVTLDANAQAEAGLSIFMAERNRYEFCVQKNNDGFVLVVRLIIGDAECIVAQKNLSTNCARLCVKAEPYNYNFYIDDFCKENFLAKAETRYLSSEVACGFTGVYWGLYAQTPCANTNACATFTELSIVHKE